MSDSRDHDPNVPLTIYQNAPLHLGSTSIRLLSLERSPSGGEIKGRLQAFEVDNCPSYIALSYAWGDPSPVHHIEIQGSRHTIRQNLFYGINCIFDYMSKRHMRSANDDDTLQTLLKEMEEVNLAARTYDGETIALPASDGLDGLKLQYIWIDSICIDQDNIDERNHQVNLMKDIFSNAHFVIAWLGVQVFGSESTIHAMETFRKYRDMRRFSPRWLYDKARVKLSFKALPFNSDTVVHLVWFLNLNYFHRMWIIQELVLARKSIALCGTDTIDTGVIRKFINLMPSVLQISPAGGTFLDRDFDHLSKLVWSFCYPARVRKCMDPRDRVYALLGIAYARNIPSGPFVDDCGVINFSRGGTRQRVKNSSTSTWDIIPNYKTSPFELFLDLLQREPSASSKSLLEILDIPQDLRIVFDDNGAKLRAFPDGPVVTKFENDFELPPNASSREYLQYVRSLDWTAVDRWPLNYQLLRKFSASLPERSSMSLQNLVWYTNPWGENGHCSWAYTTLE
jgi:hypothetical protein